MVTDFYFMQEIWSVPIKALTEHWNPFQAWETPPVLIADIKNAISNKWFQKTPFGIAPKMCLAEEYAFHVQRIAYLAKHPHRTPISISIGMPALGVYVDGWFQMDDGNHRLAAAMIRGDETIRVVYDGQNSYFPVLFAGARICGFRKVENESIRRTNQRFLR